jgi:hypothetical protein
MRSLGLGLLLAACGGTDSDSAPVDTDGDSDSGVVQVGRIDQVLDCEARGGTGVAPGTDLKKATLTDPRATCNDGTPAVLFVRRASSPEAERDWVFHLQGGGTCDGRYAECANRWCERNEKMSSARTPAGMKGAGLTSPASSNPLAAANHVFFYYCSSDNWAGRVGGALVVGEGEDPSFRADFQGFHVVTAALDALEKGLASDDGTQSLPKFTDVRRAVLTGTSAGCAGVAHNADAFATRVGKDKTLIVCDANFSPDDAHLPDGAAKEAHQAARQQRYRSAVDVFDVHLDASCLAAHPGEDAWLCHTSGHILGNHLVEAPLFARMDLADNTISDGYLNAGYTLENFGRGVQATLLDAAGGAGEEAPPRPIFVYGPACGQHVGLTNDDWYNRATVRVESRDLTLAGAIVAFAGGTQILAVDTVPPTLSTCAEKTDQTD